jgi:hypothetical protein
MQMPSIAPTSEITIRPAYADDAAAIHRLAALDSAQPPASPLLLAEVDGELRAAVAVHDGTAIADPFFPTVELVTLLRGHAAAAGAGLVSGRGDVRRWNRARRGWRRPLLVGRVHA